MALPPVAGDLEQAARLVPDSRLGALMEERRALEDRLQNLTGLPGQPGSGDAARDARFRVPSFAERQAEIRAWEAQRQARLNRQNREGWQGADRWEREPRSAAEGSPALPAPASGLGATGLADPLRGPRGTALGRSVEARERLLAGPRNVMEPIDAAARPLRQVGEQLADQQRGLEDMDRRLAAEGVDATEREEIRDAVGAGAIDKVASVLGRANRAIDAPKKAVARIEQFWERREQQISGPMDRFSGYAADRDRRLSTERGGSGDLFERMQANRARALRRRRESQLQQHRDDQRRERARDRAARRRAEEERA